MKRPRVARSPNLPDPHGENIAGKNRKDARSGVHAQVNLKSDLPTDPSASATTARRAMWPYAWLTLSGIAMAGWLAAIIWIAVAFVRWLWD
jgi:hypothetical protein